METKSTHEAAHSMRAMRLKAEGHMRRQQQAFEKSIRGTYCNWLFQKLNLTKYIDI